MNRDVFLKELERELKELSIEDRREILHFYEEYFHEASIEKNMTEEEIIRELGTPMEIAGKAKEELLDVHEVQKNTFDYKVQNSPSAKIFISIMIILFNLIFVVGPYFGILGGLIGLLGGGVGLVVEGFRHLFRTEYLFSILFSSGGVLLTMTAYYLSKLYIKGTVKYLNWLGNLIKGEKK